MKIFRRTPLPPKVIKLLKDIGRFGNSRGYSAFVVGGLVRDLLLKRKNLDLDIVVESDAIGFGRLLALRLKGALVEHRRFGTCTIVTKDRLKIDMATARKESYERPAALPDVEFSSLKDDLIRRDFTINAMAVSINKDDFGRLIDFFGGKSDLSRGIIRAMHDASFIDDPTRIFRAVRFEQRFGFVIDAHTEKLIRDAIRVEMFEKVQPQRIRDELVLILKEREPLKALKRMAQLDELRFIHPMIKFDKRLVDLCNSIDETCRWYETSPSGKRAIEKWLMYLMALFDNLSLNEVRSICDRFVFRRGETLRLISYRQAAHKLSKYLSKRFSIASSKVYGLLEPLSLEVTLMVMAKAPSRLARSRIMDFISKHSGAKLNIKGADLKALGARPGPNFRKILDKVLHEKIDGCLKTKKGELAYAKRLIARSSI